MKIQFLGHSGFYIENDGARLVIDPFLTGNPLAKSKPEEIVADYVLLTHAHGDHAGDGLDIAKRCGATVISTHEVATWCQLQGAKIHSLHIGGAYYFPFGRVKLTIAHHGSSIIENNRVVSIGNPCGFLITLDGRTIYHAGDTGLFLDMKLIGELNDIGIAMLPIGGNYTMDADDALRAIAFLNPELVIPMHYDTFPVVETDSGDFAKKVTAMGKKAKVLSVGETIEI